MSAPDRRIGQSFTIPTPDHAGHTVTVERRDIEKHLAYWLRCSCGATFLLGEHWLDEAIRRGGWSPYADVDARVRAVRRDNVR
jgi:hypothetical protein